MRGTTDISNKTLVVLLSVALVLSLLGTLLTVSRVSSLGGVTGAVQQNGTVSLTVQGTADIVLRDANVSFIPGYYNASCTTNYAYLDSYNDTHENNVTCWLNSSTALGTVPYWGPRNQSATRLDQHVIENNGTSVINVSTSTGHPNATNYICGAGQCPSQNANALVQINASNNETNACSQGLQNSNTTILSATAETNVTLCNRLEYEDANDAINTYFYLKVPRDADQGAKVMTIIYIASAK